jgi:spermidine synthase
VGGTIQAFAIMLASFLLGIAGGSAAAARAATDRSRAAAGFALAQIGTGALSILAFASLPTLAALVARGGGGLPLGAAASVAVLLPASLCIGATFPFAVRIYTAHAADAATGSARVYAWNTLGAIVGAVGAGFALLPGLGFAGTVRVAVATNLTLALASSALARPRRLRLAIAAAAGLLVLLAFPLDEPWRLLRTSPLTGRPTPGDVAYFGVGRSATVLALKYDRAWMLSANGLPEAAIVDADASPNLFLEARWLGFLPVLARPDAESLLMIGLGGSTALEAIPSSVGSVEVIELEPEMVAANRAIHRARGFDPLDDPRVSLHLNDARGALLLTGARYDAIVSQPSHPWTAGASHLYTNGFFADVRARLQPGGVFVQWIGMSFIDEDLLRTLVATLLDAFPAVRVYQPSGAALLFVASDADMRLEQDAARALAASPGDFARYGVFTPEDVAAALVLDEAGARSFAEGGVINTDDRNLLAARAGRLAGGVALDAPSALRLLAEYDPLTPPPGEIDVDALVRRLVRRGAIARAARVAQSLTDPAAQQAAIGWIELGRRRPLEATRRFENALLLDPAALDPPAGLALVGRRAIADGAEAPAALTGGARAVVSGWRSVAVRDFAALRASDPELASVAPRDPLYREAIALRAHWRIVRGAAGDGATALALLDPILAAGADAEAWLLRARAGVVANRPAAAHWALFEVQRRLRRAPDRRQLARGALRVLSAIPSGAEESGLRSAFEAAAR